MPDKQTKRTLGELRNSAQQIANLYKYFADAVEIIDQISVFESSHHARRNAIKREIEELEAIRNKAKAEAQKALDERDSTVQAANESRDKKLAQLRADMKQAEEAHLAVLGRMELELKTETDKFKRDKATLAKEKQDLINRRDELRGEVANAEARRKKILKDLGVEG